MEAKKAHTHKRREKHQGPERRYNLAKITFGAKVRVRIRTRVSEPYQSSQVWRRDGAGVGSTISLGLLCYWKFS